jgi:hypothetical protein
MGTVRDAPGRAECLSPSRLPWDRSSGDRPERRVRRRAIRDVPKGLIICSSLNLLAFRSSFFGLFGKLELLSLLDVLGYRIPIAWRSSPPAKSTICLHYPLHERRPAALFDLSPVEREQPQPTTSRWRRISCCNSATSKARQAVLCLRAGNSGSHKIAFSEPPSRIHSIPEMLEALALLPNEQCLISFVRGELNAKIACRRQSVHGVLMFFRFEALLPQIHGQLGKTRGDHDDASVECIHRQATDQAVRNRRTHKLPIAVTTSLYTRCSYGFKICRKWIAGAQNSRNDDFGFTYLTENGPVARNLWENGPIRIA